MSNKYLLVRYDFTSGRSSTISVSDNQHQAILDLQDYVIRFIQSKDGTDRIVDSEPQSLERCILHLSKFGQSTNRLTKYMLDLPSGHYIVVDNKNFHNRWAVWQKYDKRVISRGIIYNSEYILPQVSKTFEIEVVLLNTALLGTSIGITNDPILDSEEGLSEFVKTIKALGVFSELRQSVDNGNFIKISDMKTRFPGEFERPKRDNSPRDVIETHKQLANEAITEFEMRKLKNILDK